MCFTEKKGSFNPCVQEADLALGPFGITVSRTKVIDFTESFHFGDYTILSRKGEPEIDPWGFLYPLTESVWAAVVAALVVAWLVTMVMARRPWDVMPSSWAGELLLQHLRVFFNQGVSDTTCFHETSEWTYFVNKLGLCTEKT